MCAWIMPSCWLCANPWRRDLLKDMIYAHLSFPLSLWFLSISCKKRRWNKTLEWAVEFCRLMEFYWEKLSALLLELDNNLIPPIPIPNSNKLQSECSLDSWFGSQTVVELLILSAQLCHGEVNWQPKQGGLKWICNLWHKHLPGAKCYSQWCDFQLCMYGLAKAL